MENRSFEEWFDAFVECLRIRGYEGPIDKDSAMSDFDSGLDAMEAAEFFLEEYND